jgi:hypothetical protein
MVCILNEKLSLYLGVPLGVRKFRYNSRPTIAMHPCPGSFFVVNVSRTPTTMSSFDHISLVSDNPPMVCVISSPFWVDSNTVR